MTTCHLTGARFVRLSVLLTCFAFASGAMAATISETYAGSFPASISGTLPNQNTALLETFTLASASNVNITTTSYTGGGFQTNLLLFNSSGNFIAAGMPFGMPDPSNMLIGDSRITAAGLAAGTYTLAVADFLLNQSLTATNLSDGFTQNYGNGVSFVDANGNQRTGNYAFSITAASASAVPEPSSLWLVGPFAAAALLRLKKRASSTQSEKEQ